MEDDVKDDMKDDVLDMPTGTWYKMVEHRQCGLYSLREMVMRVEVWNGDHTECLGQGEYVGDVTVYVMLMPDGSLRSLANAEVRPSDSEIAESGGELVELDDNPKIVLDSCTVVYGCQVWWGPVSDPVNPN